uniref:Uncharacterized protein n=1 Tax=Onchocerca volvulus TaxID=6282 RepID=A0A8R1U302_ONCVO
MVKAVVSSIRLNCPSATKMNKVVIPDVYSSSTIPQIKYFSKQIPSLIAEKIEILCMCIKVSVIDSSIGDNEYFPFLIGSFLCQNAVQFNGEQSRQQYKKIVLEEERIKANMLIQHVNLSQTSSNVSNKQIFYYSNFKIESN